MTSTLVRRSGSGFPRARFGVSRRTIHRIVVRHLRRVLKVHDALIQRRSRR